jgi:hypothetical protein
MKLDMEPNMEQLNIRAVAEFKGITLADISRECKMDMSTTRRYYYNSKSGSPTGNDPLDSYRRDVLDTIAAFLQVDWRDLFTEGEENEAARNATTELR